MCEIDDKNRIKEQYISSHAFHRTPGGHIWEITAGERFKPRILESFDPMTQEHNLASPAVHTQSCLDDKSSRKCNPDSSNNELHTGHESDQHDQRTGLDSVAE
jgi:hypothetical protein